MEKLFITGGDSRPEILFSPEDNIFRIKGISRPEDARSVFYSAITWLNDFYKDLLISEEINYSLEDPFIIQLNLSYFNSSSAKFLFDIIMVLKKMRASGIVVSVVWFYEKNDTDMRDAGKHLSELSEIDFVYLPK
ncbi:MAG: DUF1987 domain-containing protein [Bacteroidales bacterium]|nr:DUF1987 domain-containing protein [Bacteroidales bacterium]